MTNSDLELTVLLFGYQTPTPPPGNTTKANLAEQGSDEATRARMPGGRQPGAKRGGKPAVAKLQRARDFFWHPTSHGTAGLTGWSGENSRRGFRV